MAVTEAQILVRRGTATQWSTENPVLGSGEWGYDETNKIAKMGDGSTAWNSLVANAGLSDADPVALGTADSGDATTIARANHVHPTTGLVLTNDARLTDARTPTSHNHGATEITSGTLPVARGGTGQAALTAGRYLRGDGTNSVQLRTNAEVRTDLGVSQTADLILRTAGVVTVDHGATASTARPTASMVIWRGTVEPDNWVDGDIYLDLS